ncbi:transposase [Parablautia muri]
MTVPGISYHIATIIIIEIDSFTNFSSAEPVVAYVTLNPSVYQSGQMTFHSCQNSEMGLQIPSLCLIYCRQIVYLG